MLSPVIAGGRSKDEPTLMSAVIERGRDDIAFWWGISDWSQIWAFYPTDTSINWDGSYYIVNRFKLYENSPAFLSNYGCGAENNNIILSSKVTIDEQWFL
jgi:hypothetical protein